MAIDKKSVIKELIEIGKAKGQLSTKEILDALGELDFDPEQIDTAAVRSYFYKLAKRDGG